MGAHLGLIDATYKQSSDDAFITPTFAIVLLLCITLIFASAHIQWSTTVSAEIQEVADAAALAGAGIVANYRTIAVLVDSIILSLGLLGLTALALGIVFSLVPSTQGLGVKITETGGRIMSARSKFADKAVPAINKLSEALPLLVAIRGTAIINANKTEHSMYSGTVLPFPLTPGSTPEIPANLEAEASQLHAQQEEIAELTAEKEEYLKLMDEAVEIAWLSDCGNEGYSMQQRAATVGGLPASLNPRYENPEHWDFGIGLKRAQEYYSHRFNNERPQNTTDEELSRSVSRKAFYRYAKETLSGVSVPSKELGGKCTLPYLARNTEGIKSTTLYHEEVYPVTTLEDVPTLHASMSCSLADIQIKQESVKQIDTGILAECPACQFSVKTLGSTPAASTSIENGFEYHLRKFTDAAYKYAEAYNGQQALDEQIKQITETGLSTYDQALDLLTSKRMSLDPPGRYGCIAFVVVGERQSSDAVDSAFFDGLTLPPGAAISGAVLAPSTSEYDDTVISDFFLRVEEEYESSSVLVPLADTLMNAWSGLLTSYGKGISSATSGIENILSLGGESNELSQWATKTISQTLDTTGFAPVNIDVVKPTLVNTADILNQSGMDQMNVVRTALDYLPQDLTDVDAGEVIAALGGVASDLGYSTVIELGVITIPGTEIEIPLSVDISELGMAA